jgi:hypothetical protein
MNKRRRYLAKRRRAERQLGGLLGCRDLETVYDDIRQLDMAYRPGIVTWQASPALSTADVAAIVAGTNLIERSTT